MLPAAKERLKVVIVHDWLTADGGAEKVLKTLLEMYPHADVYTLVDTLPEEQRQWLEETRVRSFQHILLRWFPRKYRLFLPLMPFWIEQLDVSGYDLVISSSHAVAKGVICHPHQTHIAYIYSPMRYAWDLQFEHFKRGDFGKGLKLWLIKRWLHRFRMWDALTFLRPDKVIATSGFIAKRIQHVCNRDCPVIYPPVKSPDFSIVDKELDTELKGQEYFLVTSRLVPYKGIDKVVEAFRSMPDKRLVVIGKGPMESKLEAHLPPNVELKGFLPESEMLAYLVNAKAFIHMAIEDFGIAPLEAQFAGVPVIAYSRGALSETIRDVEKDSDCSGILFHQQTSKALVEAIEKFLQTKFMPENCKRNAQRFNEQRFKESFQSAVNEVINSRQK